VDNSLRFLSKQSPPLARRNPCSNEQSRRLGDEKAKPHWFRRHQSNGPRDTQFSPVDVRTLAERHRQIIGSRLVFDRQADGRTKTGRAAIGTLSRRTERLVKAYLASLQIELHPDAILFRTRSGNSYGRETLGHDFASVRNLAFPGDKRRLMDMRRSGVVEAVAGDAGPIGLAAKLANSISRSNSLHKTYAPVDIEAVRNTDAARLRGRQRMRLENESRVKVSKTQPGRVSND
jgi:hypothetical protein